MANGLDYRGELEEGKIVIFTDGACIDNPGPGGYGTVLLFKENRKEISGGFSKTTSNRMELMACIVGLDTLKRVCDVIIFSDSKYVVNSINNGWATKWRANGWMRTKTEPARNPDLWSRLLSLCEKHEVRFQWIKGHSGITENEVCDILSSQAAQKPDLPIDKGFIEDGGKLSLFN